MPVVSAHFRSLPPPSYELLVIDEDRGKDWCVAVGQVLNLAPGTDEGDHNARIRRVYTYGEVTS